MIIYVLGSSHVVTRVLHYPVTSSVVSCLGLIIAKIDSVGLKSLWLLASVLISVAEEAQWTAGVGQDACAQPS